MTLNIFGYVIQVHFSVRKDTLVQDMRIIFQTTEGHPVVPMIKHYRKVLGSQGKNIPGLKESKDYVDSLILKFKRERS
jgi:hypothetical protein